jgi:hypothetical protein
MHIEVFDDFENLKAWTKGGKKTHTHLKHKTQNKQKLTFMCSTVACTFHEL